MADRVELTQRIPRVYHEEENAKAAPAPNGALDARTTSIVDRDAVLRCQHFLCAKRVRGTDRRDNFFREASGSGNRLQRRPVS